MTFSAEARNASTCIRLAKELSIKKFEPDIRMIFQESVDPEKSFTARVRIKPPRKPVDYIVAHGRTTEAAVNRLMIDLRKIAAAK